MQNIIKQITKPNYTHYFHDVHASGYPLKLVELARTQEALVVVLLTDPAQLQNLKNELEFYLADSSEIPVVTFPDWETLPYDYFSPHQDIISERLETLYQLPRLKRGLLLLPVTSALQKLPSRHFVENQSLILNVGDKLNLESLKETLFNNGYSNVSKVMEHGEYAIRGSILDIYPTGTLQPIRIELFDDEIDSLRYFDAETQLTESKTSSINILPAREFPSDEKAIAKFRQSWRSTFDSDIKQSTIYRDVSNGLFPAGIEYYLPLFFDNLSTIFDFLPNEETLFVAQEESGQTINVFWGELNERYEQHRYDRERPILSPQTLYLTRDEFFEAKKQFPAATFSNKTPSGNTNSLSLGLSPCPNVSVEHKENNPFLQLQNSIKEYSTILICAESPGRQEVIKELLQKQRMQPSLLTSWLAFEQTTSKINLITAPLASGFSLGNQLVVCESDLFGRQVLQRRRRSSKVASPDQLIHSLAELKVGDPVVHIEQGVGRYLGLQTIEAGGIATEFLTLEYQGGSKLYVPVQSLNQIHRYSGSNPELAPWHKLGSESWGKAKQKAIEKARDTAAELLDIYARRGAQIGFKHQLDNSDYLNFASEFPFELTEDQDTAIKAVIKDMTSKQPMDRLVCGDVGFGKTEVAMRAAFTSVNNNKQVAILVPTTLLAQQHFNSFQDRFSQWPVNIAVLSRFQTKKEQTETLEKLESGKVDLVIGTHRLISGNLKFKDLGLLVIDEEHRFGVRQKEILKSYRSKVDILTLTATPIPRTLNMSMSGMRDLSIIATPPAKRLAIKTFVRQRNEPLIKEAIQREIRRGGQIYFLHNSVETIDKTAKELQQMLPEIVVGVAHGQMRERQLEDVMKQFYHHKYHILVCTTIIETGIDVPTANTIIMDRADKLGLAQLHQLRGRVGRSHHQAYAYLLTPPPKSITKDAKKRLEAIGKLEDLGAGFILATHDLEIRGAGELLGDEQSGHMQTIGYSLYMELLDRAIASLKTGEDVSLNEAKSNLTEVNLGISALLPDDYVFDVAIRLSLYKRIASAKNNKELRDLQVELIDRFGLLPAQAKNLFIISELQLTLSSLGVLKFDSTASTFKLEFNGQPSIDTGKLISLIQTDPNRYQLVKGTVLQVTQSAENIETRIEQLESLIETLTP
ncbi:MAG: transcription-repair coupling factor [Kangiellaceae bacterium]|nr:transcription-repair coupling factor [Kangiellaceae bacterium]